LQRAAPFLGDQPLAARVRALAIRGADALVEDDERRAEAIERLISFSVNREPLVDWDVLERIEEETHDLPVDDEE
jgi:hypothetical protein